MIRPLVITSCTKRKRRLPGPSMGAVPPTQGDLATFATAWTTWLRSQPTGPTAADYYCGTGFSCARRAAHESKGRLYVVSAGLGLVDGSEPVVDYELTVTSGAEGSLANLLRSAGASATEWWASLNKASGLVDPLSALVRSHNGLALIALPSVYCELVRADLSRLSPSEASRLRIFTSELGARSIPEELQSFVMPYDERLEGTSHAGTRADFPQRSLHHFVSALSGHSVDLRQAREMVEFAMQQSQRPAVRQGGRRTDEEVAELIRANWDRFAGQSSRLLRFLRDEAQVACEQGRFRNIWATVRDTHAA